MDQGNLSDIQDFYKEKCVLLTGATGFLGKLILEKLLRSTEVQKIYLLVRRNRKDDPEKRVEKLLECPIFDGIKRISSECLSKIIVVHGDMSLIDLGLEEKILKNIVKEVNCVFHTAVAAKVNQTIVDASLTNIRGTGELLNIARSMKKLKSFVLVSTAYSNCVKEEIDEKIYDLDVDVEEFITSIESDGVKGLEKYKSLTEKWPSSFTFTMALAENLIKNESGKLPVAIVRCSSIIATNLGPIRGYIDSCHGPTGVVIGVGLGILRVFYGDDDKVGDIVTADYVINNAIAAGWAVNEYKDYDKFEKLYLKDKVPVFNCVSSPNNPITWKTFGEIMDKYGKESPSSKLMWYPYKIVTSCLYNYLLLKFLLHTIPAFILDIVLLCVGKRGRISGFYDQMEGYTGNIQYFMNNSWVFNDSNNKELIKGMTRKDRELFNFDHSDIDWESYLEYYMKGIRVYILKDEMNTVKQGQKKLQTFKYLHYSLITLGCVILYLFARFFLKMFLGIFFNV
ncbi:unnamed protein product [Brassicogethes aeneus]|uniref:Fatty acyl-CoA reductase n=1 Tax=Brassicogethes aeneus TaxID=1431903 RepID=A0A9P0AVZ1_BRAAE|nr:unnamed protein product [Brassicogethes aeneus]